MHYLIITLLLGLLFGCDSPSTNVDEQVSSTTANSSLVSLDTIIMPEIITEFDTSFVSPLTYSEILSCSEAFPMQKNDMKQGWLDRCEDFIATQPQLKAKVLGLTLSSGCANMDRLMYMNPYYAVGAKEATEMAKDHSKEDYGENIPILEDMYRHILWNLYIMKSASGASGKDRAWQGRRWAQAITDTYEDCNPNDYEDRIMDYHNNRVARNYGESLATNKRFVTFIYNVYWYTMPSYGRLRGLAQHQAKYNSYYVGEGRREGEKGWLRGELAPWDKYIFWNRKD